MKIVNVYFLVFSSIFISVATDNISWNWVCNKTSKQCERVQSTPPGAWKNTPLEVCRLTCGKYGALWPVPTIKTVIKPSLITFHPRNIYVDISTSNNRVRDFLAEITKLFTENLDRECGGICDVDSKYNININITTNAKDTLLRLNTDESYSLNVTTKDTTVTINIVAATVFGVRHGLETLSQLTASYEIATGSPEGSAFGLVMVSDAFISDKPVYLYRGLLVDTGRNYLSLSAIKRQIDGMAASKLNVLHWHATDSQSFPIESRRVPNLSRYGAYSDEKVYTLTDINNLVRYANYRGVRILMEIDAPSHAGNGWQWGPEHNLGDLAVCVNKNPWRQNCIQPPCGQLNPANPNVHDVLGMLYRDLSEAMPVEQNFHMGGDEVFFGCWNSTPEILSYLAQQGKGNQLSDFLDLWAEFQSKALRQFDGQLGHSDTPITLWSSDLTSPDVIEKYLSPDRYIIETWVPASSDLPAKLLQKGYKLIVSTKDAWYLDHGFWGMTTYHAWRDVYKNRIPRQDGVLGGEVCMWGELVDDSNVDARIWPRAAAAAERLWSDPNLSTPAVESRFYRHRNRLLARGLQPDALAPGWCVLNEGECR